MAVVACVVGLGSLGSAVASADTLGPFIDYLDRNGVDVSTIETQNADVQLGRAICDMYPAALAAGVNPNHRVMDQLQRQHTTDEAAVWVVGSVMYMCPEYEYLLP